MSSDPTLLPVSADDVVETLREPLLVLSADLRVCAPATPLLFMGQEWAADTPFLFFTDHPEELGRLVTEGRRKEFQDFRQFCDEQARCRIPDPQDESTFTKSQLNWHELTAEPHQSMFRLYQALLTLRRHEPAIRYAQAGTFHAYALSNHTLLLRQDADVGPSLLAIIQMEDSEEVSLVGHPAMDGLVANRCQVILTTEDPPFASDSQPPVIDLSGSAPRICFKRPSAVLLRAWTLTDPAIRAASEQETPNGSLSPSASC